MITSNFYNKEQKQLYLDSLPIYDTENPKTVFISNFNIISKYEHLFQKDISEMSLPQLLNVLSMTAPAGYTAKSIKLSFYKDYIDWCIKNGKTAKNVNLLDEVTAKDINSSLAIKSQRIKNKNHLNEILETVYKMNDDEMQEQIKLICWLAFYGFNTDDIINLKKIDIDYDKKQIYKQSTEQKIDIAEDFVMELCRNCSNHTKITSINAHGYYDKKLKDNNYVFRNTYNCEDELITETFIRRRFRKLNNDYAEFTGGTLSLSVDRINLSGIFYKIYLLEQTGEAITQNTMIEYFNIHYENESTMRNEPRKILIDYTNWKKAFEL